MVDYWLYFVSFLLLERVKKEDYDDRNDSCCGHDCRCHSDMFSHIDLVDWRVWMFKVVKTCIEISMEFVICYV